MLSVSFECQLLYFVHDMLILTEVNFDFRIFANNSQTPKGFDNKLSLAIVNFAIS